MSMRPAFYLILVALGQSLFGPVIQLASAQAPSQRVIVGSEYPIDEYRIDAQQPLPFSTSAPACGSACSTDCCSTDRGACDSWDPYAKKFGCMSKLRFDMDSCKVYGAVDYLLLDRTNDAYERPFVVNANSGATLFSSDDPEFDYESGVRATIGIGHVGYCCLPAFEVTYLGVYDWNDSTTLSGSGDLSLVGDLGFGAVNGFTLAERIQTEYESQLNSAEANYFVCLHEYCCGDCFSRIDWLVGPRYLSLNEDLSVLGNNVNVANARYAVDTDNDLYGAQTGARIRRFKCNWGWELIGKAGVFGNDASQSQNIVDELGVNDFVVRNASLNGK